MLPNRRCSTNDLRVCWPEDGRARQMKDLEKENAWHRPAVSDLMLDKLILQEGSRGSRRRALAKSCEPREPQALYRSYPGHDAGVRATDLQFAQSASVDTGDRAAQGR